MKTRLLALISLALVLLLAGSALADLPSYNIFHIGLIDPAADFGSQGTDVSTTLGNVTGRNLGNNNQAIFWTEEGGLVGLPNLASRPYAVGNGVNMFGTVVGTGATTFYGSSPLPLIWENGVVAQLPLPAGQDMGRANAINNLGVAVGSVNGGSLEAPAIYENGTATIITRATDTGCTGTTFYDINDAGLAVGPGTDPANAARNVGYVYDMATNSAFEVGALEGRNGACPALRREPGGSRGGQQHGLPGRGHPLHLDGRRRHAGNPSARRHLAGQRQGCQQPRLGGGDRLQRLRHPLPLRRGEHLPGGRPAAPRHRLEPERKHLQQCPVHQR